jgi:signal recognition particle receptor subunit beta
MAYVPSDGAGDGMLAAFKIVVAGGFGAGKTTLVGAVSEVQPLRTEETLTAVSIGTDDLAGVGSKTTTTVAMDFGRITLSNRLVLYLFGTPGQERFWFMWDELSYGALGAVVLADTRRLDDCFPAVDYFERCQLPFVVAINCFDESPRYDPEDVRVALDLGPSVPVMLCDARQVASVKQILITLVEHVLATAPPVLQGQGQLAPAQPHQAQPHQAQPHQAQLHQAQPSPAPVPASSLPPAPATPPARLDILPPPIGGKPTSEAHTGPWRAAQ